MSRIILKRLENVLKTDSEEFRKFQHKRAEEMEKTKEEAEKLVEEKRNINDAIRNLSISNLTDRTEPECD